MANDTDKGSTVWLLAFLKQCCLLYKTILFLFIITAEGGAIKYMGIKAGGKGS
jgi:hypothetical protein